MKKLIKKIIINTLILSELFTSVNVYALTKEENVYAKLNEKGDVESVSISEHLYDYNGKEINDKTLLNDIKNVNGREKFTKKDNNLIWESSGNDIYYQGSYSKDLPINMNIKYFLDNEEKDINDILGKKGKIKISITFKNSASKKVNINGKMENIYVPYMIVTTTILNNANNKNIKVTNGKIINNGTSSVIMALSSPGLYESLKNNKVKDLDKVELTFDTESFELNPIYSVATTSLFDDSNINIFSEINSLYKNIDLLQSNMNKIVDASKKLSNGSNLVDAGITELNKKIQELIKKYEYYKGQDRNTLKEELIKIVEKNINTITPALEDEITNETIKLIKENKDELEKSVISYTEKNTKTVVDEEIKNIVNKLDVNSLISKVLNSNLYNLLKDDEEIKSLTSVLKNDINKELKNIITSEVSKLSEIVKVSSLNQEEYINNIASKYGVTYEQAKGIVGEVQVDTLNEIKNNIKNYNIEERIINILNDKNYLSNLVNNYINKLNNKLSEYLNKDTTVLEYANILKEKILVAINKDLEEGKLYLNKNIKEHIEDLINKIINNTANDLSSKYTEEYTSKVVKNVINKEFSEENVDSKLRELLEIYEDDINKKVTIIDDTVNTLKDALNRLNTGSNQVTNGIKALSDGLDKYNREGINKISKLVNSDVKLIQKRLDALIKISNDNKMIDNVPKNAKSNSKIIFMIDSKSKTVEEKIEIKEEKKETFWDRVTGLFN